GVDTDTAARRRDAGHGAAPRPGVRGRGHRPSTVDEESEVLAHRHDVGRETHVAAPLAHRCVAVAVDHEGRLPGDEALVDPAVGVPTAGQVAELEATVE